MASLFSHTIGLPPIVAHGSEALKRRVVPDGARRARRSPRSRSPSRAAAPTSPGCDCSARRDGDALGHRRREDLHHLGPARRLDHGRGAHRRARAPRGISLLAVPGDAPGLDAHAAGQDGLVVQRHRAAALRRLPRAGRSPDRRGERGLSRDHGELQRRAAADVGRRRRASPRSATTRRWTGRASARPSAPRWSSTRSIRHKLMDMRMRIASSARLARTTLVERHDAGDAGDPDWVAAALPAEEPRDADDAVLRRRRRCRSSAAWATCAAPRASASTARSR